MQAVKVSVLALFMAVWAALPARTRVFPDGVPEQGRNDVTTRGEVLVRQIDHILIGSDEPERLFRLFTRSNGSHRRGFGTNISERGSEYARCSA